MDANAAGSGGEMTRPIPLRHGARTPQARVLERKHNAVIQSLASEQGMSTFSEGRLFELVTMTGQLAAQLDMMASRIAIVRKGESVLHPTDIAALVRATGHLEGAARTLRDVTAIGKPVLMQAAE